MKKHFNIYRFVQALFLAAGFGLILMAAFGSVIAFSIGFLISLTISCLPGDAWKRGFAFDGIFTEVWEDGVERNLWRNNKFLEQSIDDSKYVNNITVHIPNAGMPPDVTIDGVLPAGAVDTEQMEYQDRNYNISVFRTKPFVVRNAEQAQVSFNEMDSVLYESTSAINQKVAERMLISWAPTGGALLVDGVTVNNNILRTSGIRRNDPAQPLVQYKSHLPGTAGMRLGFGIYDIIAAGAMLDDMDVPEEDRNMLLDSQLYRQLLDDLSPTQYADFSRAMDPKTGIIGNLLGFNIYKRSRALAYTNDDLPVVKALGASFSANDNAAALCWWKGAVSKSMGKTDVFEQAKAPGYYGDVLSLEIRAGGASRRPTELGICAIVQQKPPVGGN